MWINWTWLVVLFYSINRFIDRIWFLFNHIKLGVLCGGWRGTIDISCRVMKGCWLIITYWRGLWPDKAKKHWRGLDEIPVASLVPLYWESQPWDITINRLWCNQYTMALDSQEPKDYGCTYILDSFDEINIQMEKQRRIKQGEPVRVSDVRQ